MDIKEYIRTLKPTFMGHLLYYCFRKRSRVALESINRVYQDKLTLSEKTKLLKAFCSHLIKMTQEFFCILHFTDFNPYIDVRGLEHLQQGIANKKGVILLVAHLGSWELGVLKGLGRISCLEQKLNIIRKPQKKRVQDILIRVYQRAGIKIIDSKGGLMKMYKALKRGEVIVFPFDQHMPVGKFGIAAEFFGVHAGCHRTLPLMVKMTNASVVPINFYRKSHNHHVLEFYPQLTWREGSCDENSMYQNVLQYNHIIEQFILEHPEQWFWVHRRWKLNAQEARIKLKKFKHAPG